jgi:hypothetical protein
VERRRREPPVSCGDRRSSTLRADALDAAAGTTSDRSHTASAARVAWRSAPGDADVMLVRPLALAIAAGACGQVAHEPVDGAPTDQTNEIPTTYKAHLGQVMPVMFGGSPFCTYTITLEQLDVELAIVPSGRATSGKVQALNVEGVVQPCGEMPIPPKIATYTLASATPQPGGVKLTFQGASDNVPNVSLVANLSAVGSAYTAMLGFHRIDQPTQPVLEWSVVTTVTLTPP